MLWRCVRRGARCGWHCRRGAAEATQLTQELSQAVDTVRGMLCKHMRREELEVLPLLQAHLCVAEQRSMVWRMLRAMPLRLLQRVMPVLAGAAPRGTPCAARRKQDSPPGSRPFGGSTSRQGIILQSIVTHCSSSSVELSSCVSTYIHLGQGLCPSWFFGAEQHSNIYLKKGRVIG